LKEKNIVAIGADNAAVEAYIAEGRSPTSPRLHITALRDLGVYLIEHVDLEELAADQVYEFLFVAAPLRLPKATGSPLTPLALI
jgi:kynurenine formamidase